jgi:hypothetical protein
MALAHSTGKKRRNTGGILSIFTEIMRQIGGAGSSKAFSQRFPKRDAGQSNEVVVHSL